MTRSKAEGDRTGMNKLSAMIRSASAIFCLITAFNAVASGPKDVMLVLDNSGSMHKNDPQFLARGAVASFIDDLDTDSRAGLLIFDQSVTQAVPLTSIDDAGKGALIRALDNINYRGQLTDSPAAIERAIYELKTNARDDAEKFIIFMTDGIVDTGQAAADVEKTKWLREELADDAAENRIKVYAIAFTEHADFFLIQSLAKKTDGEYFRALTPADLTDVFASVRDKLSASPPASEKAEVTTFEPPPRTEMPIVEPTVAADPIEVQAEPKSATDLLASLSAEDRQALEEISADTGIPIEQLATELVGPASGPAAGEGETIVTYPEDVAIAEDKRTDIIMLGVAALALLFLAAFGAWLMMRGRREPTDATSAGAMPTGHAAAPISLAFLRDTHGYTDQASMPLGEKPVMVGRVSGTDSQHLDYMVVDKGTVGRRHAIIKYKDFAYWVVDQGSVNGTYVNDERVSGERQLKHGDLVRFHKYDFEFSQPEIEDDSQTILAVPNLEDATIVASASTIAVSAASLQAAADIVERDDVALEGAESSGVTADLFGVIDENSDLSSTDEHGTAVFANSDVFDTTGDSITGAADPAIDDKSSLVSDLRREADGETKSTQTPDSGGTDGRGSDEGDEYDYDEDDASLEEATRETASDTAQPSLFVQSTVGLSDEEIDAEASEFFEDITVGPTPDDVPSGDARADDEEEEDTFDFHPDEAERSEIDSKFERAAAILDTTAQTDAFADTQGFDEFDTVARTDLPAPEDPNDLTLDKFLETDSFDAPETAPPVHPNVVVGEDAGDVTLDSFISTSKLVGASPALTNQDETVLPDQVPDDPHGGVNVGDTMVLGDESSTLDEDDEIDEDEETHPKDAK